MDLREARFAEQLTDLDERPESPVVDKGVLDACLVGELEVDAALHVASDRVELLLLPHICEGAPVIVLDFFGFPGLGHGFGAAVVIEEKNALLAQAVAHGLEIGAEIITRFEQPVAEVHRKDAVHAGRVTRIEDISIEQGDPRLRVRVEQRDMVLVPVIECRLIDVQPNRAVAGAPADPLGTGVARATEIFSQHDRLSSTDVFEGLIDEIDLGFDILDGELVEIVLVRRGRGIRAGARCPLCGLGLEFLVPAGLMGHCLWTHRDGSLKTG